MESNQHITGAKWRKSSYSGDTGGECVECAPLGDGLVAVRDSKNPDGPVFTVHPAAFATFVRALSV
ncbi:DUF397 domain-containing protein [Streptomyces sp. NPDC048424]|uniref:DUF397 domain-containing protein n=1 Tax=Streptomyces sp. NPDC048424 TaxID=3155265 RepID=UPI00343F073B